MATTKQLAIKELHLDLKNYRTVPQKNEIDAVNAMIAIHTNRFWSLMESILEDDGYLPSENIIVLKDEKDRNIVKEGNRRIACLKLIHNIIPRKSFSIPRNISDQIENLTDDWKKNNSTVPCLIFQKKDSRVVDRIVNLIHGKGEKASRDKWESVAKARHNREENGASEPALDLLEKYLSNGRNLSSIQKDRWAGDYHLYVLTEALSKIATRVNEEKIKDIVAKYPSLPYREQLEEVMREIGNEDLTFPILRDSEDILHSKYGFPKLKTSPLPETTSSSKSKKSAAPKKAAASTSKKSNTAHSIDDPRTVRAILKAFHVQGIDRKKIATLRDEALKLKLDDNPIAFCLLLRSMFEISATIYCTEEGISLKKQTTDRNGTKRTIDKTLTEKLTAVYENLTKEKSDKSRIQQLHGAHAELKKPHGLLSVTSMNQLVHHPEFSVKASDICNLFSRVYPLLEYMNH